MLWQQGSPLLCHHATTFQQLSGFRERPYNVKLERNGERKSEQVGENERERGSVRHFSRVPQKNWRVFNRKGYAMSTLDHCLAIIQVQNLILCSSCSLVIYQQLCVAIVPTPNIPI